MKLDRVALGLALVLAVGALALTVQERVTRNDREKDVANAARGAVPTLTIHHVEGPGAFARSATHVQAGKFDGANARCPKGFVVVGGGASISGPGILTDDHADSRNIWRADIFNGTSALSTGSETANLSVSAVCVKGEGIEIKTQGFDF